MGQPSAWRKPLQHSRGSSRNCQLPKYFFGGRRLKQQGSGLQRLQCYTQNWWCLICAEMWLRKSPLPGSLQALQAFGSCAACRFCTQQADQTYKTSFQNLTDLSCEAETLEHCILPRAKEDHVDMFPDVSEINFKNCWSATYFTVFVRNHGFNSSPGCPGCPGRPDQECPVTPGVRAPGHIKHAVRVSASAIFTYHDDGGWNPNPPMVMTWGRYLISNIYFYIYISNI